MIFPYGSKRNWVSAPWPSGRTELIFTLVRSKASKRASWRWWRENSRNERGNRQSTLLAARRLRADPGPAGDPRTPLARRAPEGPQRPDGEFDCRGRRRRRNPQPPDPHPFRTRSGHSLGGHDRRARFFLRRSSPASFPFLSTSSTRALTRFRKKTTT